MFKYFVRNGIKTKLYYHKTDGGAEYLSDTYIECPDGSKEGTFGDANVLLRIDGGEIEIIKDNPLMIAYLDCESVCNASVKELNDIEKSDNIQYYTLEDFVIAFNEEYITDLGLIKLARKENK